MKKTFKNVALLTALSLVAVSCQKEDVLPIIGTEQTADSIYVVYSINGEVYHATLGESEWDAFMERMLALARDGYEVIFSKNRTSLTSQSKEKVTFVTNSKEEAYSWSSAMIDQGYTVSITYNQSTGEYTCIAIK